ncbi:Coq4 family protein [Hyphomonas sp.]|uniref:Coq4 family protein n=1 Tax=Hyphomonas sp. TaxID=87 RepID=UPI003F71582A
MTQTVLRAEYFCVAFPGEVIEPHLLLQVILAGRPSGFLLQAHDLWHITAGYETIALREIANSAFQMAQFGHNYSASFLSITAVLGAAAPGQAYRVLMDTITSAWTIGRQSPTLMLISWENVWHQPVQTSRNT